MNRDPEWHMGVNPINTSLDVQSMDMNRDPEQHTGVNTVNASLDTQSSRENCCYRRELKIANYACFPKLRDPGSRPLRNLPPYKCCRSSIFIAPWEYTTIP